MYVHNINILQFVTSTQTIYCDMKLINNVSLNIKCTITYLFYMNTFSLDTKSIHTKQGLTLAVPNSVVILNVQLKAE